jgi:outer membrane immunogenic protein
MWRALALKKILLLAASAAVLSSQVFAADMINSYEPAPVAAAVPASAFNWSGAYIGAHLGYGWGETHDIGNVNAVAKDLDGILGGLQAGYNAHLPNNIVLGIEASASFADIKNEWHDPELVGTTGLYNSGYYTEDKVEAIGTLKARLGYAMDNFLPYVTGGLAIARTSHVLGCSRENLHPDSRSCGTNSAGNLPFEDSQSDTSVGWTVGAGAEYAFDQNWSLKAEYLYTDIGTNTVTLVDPNATAPINDREFDTHFHTVSFGINYRF